MTVDSWLTSHPVFASRLGSTKPSAVYQPDDEASLRDALADAAARSLPLLPVGGGRHTPCLDDRPFAVLSTERLNAIQALDQSSGVIKVGAGISVGALEEALRAAGLTLSHLGPLPNDATWGGLLSRAWPMTPVMHSPDIRSVCVALDAYTSADERFHYTPSPRKSSGPDLRGMFLGAEGQRGVISTLWLAAADLPEQTLRLRASAPTRAPLLAALRDATRDGLRHHHSALFDDKLGATLVIEIAAGPRLVALAAKQITGCLQRHGLTPEEVPETLYPNDDVREAVADPIGATLNVPTAMFSGQASYDVIDRALAASTHRALITHAQAYGAHVVLFGAADAEVLEALRALPWGWSRPCAPVDAEPRWLTRWRDDVDPLWLSPSSFTRRGGR